MYTHIHNESLTPNLEVFNIFQLLTHVSFYFLRTQGARVSLLQMRRMGPRGVSTSAHMALNLGYQHPEFGLFILSLPHW